VYRFSGSRPRFPITVTLHKPAILVGPSGSPARVLEAVSPELAGQQERYNQLARELHAHGLLGVESLGSMMTAQGALEKRTTPLGDKFLQFITAPVT
jgi:hypothetical protein